MVCAPHSYSKSKCALRQLYQCSTPASQVLEFLARDTNGSNSKRNHGESRSNFDCIILDLKGFDFGKQNYIKGSGAGSYCSFSYGVKS